MPGHDNFRLPDAALRDLGTIDDYHFSWTVDLPVGHRVSLAYAQQRDDELLGVQRFGTSSAN